MPYDIGEGIAEGTRNFFQMRLQKRLKKEQDKLNSIKPIIEPLEARLRDDRVSFDEKRRIADAIFQVYTNAGIKVKLPEGQRFSDILIPQDIANQLVDTGETSQDVAINAVPEGVSQTENITTSVVDRPILRRRGEMSQAELDLGLQRKARRGMISDDLKRDKEFAKYTGELNVIIANRQMNKNPEEVVEPTTGRTWSVYTNPEPNTPPIFKPLGAYRTERGELITQPEENTIPVSTYTARERAKGAGGGLPATMKALIFAASRELGLPADSDEVLNLAADRYKDQYLARTGNLNLGVTKGQQATTGSEPIQPIEAKRISIDERKHLADLEGQAASSLKAIETNLLEVSKIENQILEKNAAKIKLMTEDGLLETDAEVVAIQKSIDSLKDKQNDASRKAAEAQDKYNKANRELEVFKGSQVESSTVSKANSPQSGDKESPQVRAAITKLNANRARLKMPELDDDAAKALLREKGFIQ